MAYSVSNNSLLFILPKPIETQQRLSFSLPSSITFPSYSSSSFSPSSIFKSNPSSLPFIPRNTRPTINAQETKISDDDEKQRWNLKYLIGIYKEAILNGDVRTVAEIEATINIIENENNEVAEKVSALTEEVTSGKEKYVRLQADFDNFRKRSEKERINIRSDAQGEVIESLLPMVDSFERAKQQLKPETDMEKKIDTSYQGIYKQFVEIMRSLRVAAVPTVGKPFDPALHEAIAREESEQYNEGIIIQEFRRGFILGDRLIRPAMVKVSSGPGPKKPSTSAEKQASTTAARVDEQ